MSFEFKLHLQTSFEDAVLPQNQHKFAILILWVPASAISMPRNTSITDVNMADVTNNTCQIKIPRALFSQIVHNTKNTLNPNDMAWRLTTHFLWLSQKSATNLNLMTKWKTYLNWMQNRKRCFTLRAAIYIVCSQTAIFKTREAPSFLVFIK